MNSTAGMAIDHPTLSAVVADSLRQLIAAGKLAPGSRLNERELCDRLKVSRTPLREAYRILSAEGLVELTPKHGARVTQLSDDDVANIFDVLAVTEGLAGRLATEKASQKALDRIAGLHRQMMAAYQARDMARYSVAAKGTHDAINEAADNPTLNGDLPAPERAGPEAALPVQSPGRQLGAEHRGPRALRERLAEPRRRRVEQVMRDHVLVKKALALAEKVDGDAPGPRTTAGRKKISRPAKPPTAGGTA